MTTAPTTARTLAVSVEDAACRALGAAELERIFFPPGSSGRRGDAREDDFAEAKAVCATCPLQPSCLAYAMDHPRLAFGVWGGQTEAERESARRRVRRARYLSSDPQDPE